MNARWGRDSREGMDDAVVERLVAGDAVPCTSWERRAAVEILSRRGLPQTRIAALIGVQPRQVYRDLKWLERAS